MRAIIPCICVIIFLNVIPAAAQVSVGVRAGVNLASASISSQAEFSSSTLSRLNIGAAVEVGLSDALFLQAEGMLSQRGAEATLNFLGQGATGDMKLDYIEIPVTLKYKFGSEGFRPYVFAGPNLAVNISAEAVSADGDVDNVEDEVTSTDLSADIGAGVAFETEAGIALAIDARYSLGLQDVVDGKSDLVFVDTWKSRDLKVLVGLLITL